MNFAALHALGGQLVTDDDTGNGLIRDQGRPLKIIMTSPSRSRA
jgi:hypothetical protein